MNRPWDLLSPEERARRVHEHLAKTHIGCAACGYDLYGLQGSACPECAAPLDHARFAYLAAEPDDQYQARRLAEYLAQNRASCPYCTRELSSVNGRACPGCGGELEVWQLIPRGLRADRGTRLKWALIITAAYIALAAAAGVIGLLMLLR